MKLAHILVATDLSQEATRCIAPVAGLARSNGARITLLHVAETLESIPRGAATAPPLVRPIDEDDAAAARTQLEERRMLFGPGLEIDTVMLAGGDPATVISEWAESHDVDLIAVATHGRTGFRRLALGSVTEALVRRSRTPVLVLPRPKGSE